MPKKTAIKKSSQKKVKAAPTSKAKKAPATKKTTKPVVKKTVVTKKKSVTITKPAPKIKKSSVKKVTPIKKKEIKVIGSKQNKKVEQPIVPVFVPRNAKVTDDEMGLRLNAALSYCLFLILVPVLTKRKNAFVNWHIRQGIPMLVFTAILMVVLPLVSTVPVLGPLAVYALLFLWMILFIWAIVSTLLGQQWKFPLFGDLASKLHI